MLVWKLCSSFSAECSRELLVNVDLLGTDIEFFYAPDTEHCQQLCTEHPSCNFFTFVRPDSSDEKKYFQCHLKSAHSGVPMGRATHLGVTSGFSLKHCSTDSEPCLSQVYQDVVFHGEDYQTLFTADYEECQRACTHYPSCQFFTFNNGNFIPTEYRYKCHLKFGRTVPRTPNVKATAGLVSGFSHKIQTTQQSDTACQIKLFPNADILRADIENMSAASPEHCHALCTAHPRCTYFSYSRYGDWVKKTYEEVDFWGSDFHNVPADDAEACQRTCTEDPNCHFYSYVTDRSPVVGIRGICYLKRVITMTAPPKVTKLANVVSGFSLKNCIGSTLLKHTPSLHPPSCPRLYWLSIVEETVAQTNRERRYPLVYHKIGEKEWYHICYMVHMGDPCPLY
ncbi:hypothetical protein L3Q82_003026 [Scortum barcoo]|uniref:Uncharacterized protein n=1 Tax=Scortum barcoo TaxID=214431 RepID=A0ACB8VRG3_9TELE|nr:hypothetical protein L3Q82_003026 [Scortum barcoo]